jgi:soluble lytic murein transglycosylase-like protein
MQVMPATGADIAARRGLTFTADRLLIPEVNVDFGAWYLADQLRRFGRAEDEDWQSSVRLAAAAYNGGPGTVQAMVQRGAALPAETSAYESWVGGMWQERRSPESPTFERWLAAGGWRLIEAASATVAMAPAYGYALP